MISRANGKQVARAFDQQQRLDVLLLDVGQLEQTAIDQFHVEHGLVLVGRLDRQLQVQLEQAVRAALGGHFDPQVDGGLAVDAQGFRGARVLEREVADVLGQDAEAGAGGLALLSLALVALLGLAFGRGGGVGHGAVFEAVSGNGWRPIRRQ